MLGSTSLGHCQENHQSNPIQASISRLIHIGLGTPLPRLSLIMPLLPPSLLLPIAHQRRRRTPHRSRHAIAHPLSEIRQLALGLLALALQILLPALALQALVAEQVAHRLLAGADRLVPRALAAVRVVFGCRPRGAEREGPRFHGRF